ncbi:recombinase family protein [Arthrobacter sp. Soil736]|uniref:recombinase family protein n=1 Tax=Arthrobacter sp. Soil736 TaxID=1736395 RepID=UPI0009E9336F|nr:recombinase family protein [Arthrobacter sp. Soil736]
MRSGNHRICQGQQQSSLQCFEHPRCGKPGCDRIFTENGVNGTRAGRPELDNILDHLRPGDELVIWKLDPLARSTKTLLPFIELLEAKGVTFSYSNWMPSRLLCNRLSSVRGDHDRSPDVCGSRRGLLLNRESWTVSIRRLKPKMIHPAPNSAKAAHLVCGATFRSDGTVGRLAGSQALGGLPARLRAVTTTSCRAAVNHHPVPPSNATSRWIAAKSKTPRELVVSKQYLCDTVAASQQFHLKGPHMGDTSLAGSVPAPHRTSPRKYCSNAPANRATTAAPPR